MSNEIKEDWYEKIIISCYGDDILRGFPNYSHICESGKYYCGKSYLKSDGIVSVIANGMVCNCTYYVIYHKNKFIIVSNLQDKIDKKNEICKVCYSNYMKKYYKMCRLILKCNNC